MPKILHRNQFVGNTVESFDRADTKRQIPNLSCAHHSDGAVDCGYCDPGIVDRAVGNSEQRCA